MGLLASKLMDPDVHIADLAARQILGTGSAVAGYEYGKKHGDVLPMRLAVALGAYGVPAQIAAAFASARARHKPVPTAVADGVRAALQSAPIPTQNWQLNRMLDPEEWVARPVPNALRDVGNLVPGLDSTTFDPHTRGVPYPFGKALQKIPGVNRALLNRKAPASAKTLRFSAMGPAEYR